MTSRGSLAAAVAGTVTGGCLVLLSSGRRWAHTTLHDVLVVGRSHLSVTGHNVAPSLPALGVALLALGVAVLAARGVLRRVVGVLVVLVGAAACGVALTARSEVSRALAAREVGAQGLPVHAGANGWWLVALLGGAWGVVAGAATVLRGDRWAAMGARYDAPSGAGAAAGEAAAPSGRAVDPAEQAWAAIDRGEDPTA